jgi:hypothetical protein
MSLFGKRGVINQVGLASTAIATAGIMSVNISSYENHEAKIETALNNVAYVSKALFKRAEYDGKNVYKQLDSTDLPEEGSIWTFDSGIDPKNCTNSPDTCRSLFNSSTEKSLNISEIRTLTSGKDSQCQSYSNNGAWTPSFGDDNFTMRSNLMPCNLFRISNKGLLGNNTSDRLTTIRVIDDPDNEDFWTLANIQLVLPLHNIITTDNFSIAGPLLLKKARDIFNPQDVILSIKYNNENIGLSPSIFVNDSCSISGRCSLVITKIYSGKMETGSSGCSDCVKQDGSNSMYSAITFSEKDKSNYLNNRVIFSWDTDEVDGKIIEEPTVDQVKSGIYKDSGGNFVLKQEDTKMYLTKSSYYLDVDDRLSVEASPGKFQVKIDRNKSKTIANIAATSSSTYLRSPNLTGSRFVLENGMITRASPDFTSFHQNTVKNVAEDSKTTAKGSYQVESPNFKTNPGTTELNTKAVNIGNATTGSSTDIRSNYVFVGTSNLGRTLIQSANTEIIGTGNIEIFVPNQISIATPNSAILVDRNANHLKINSPEVKIQVNATNGTHKITVLTANNTETSIASKLKLSGKLDGQAVFVSEKYRSTANVNLNKIDFQADYVVTNNDKFIPYPGDAVWNSNTTASLNKRREWARQVPNALQTAKMINRMVRPLKETVNILQDQILGL